MKRVLCYLLMGVRSRRLSQLIGARAVKRLISPPPLTPKGYVPVCVGVDGDTKRFMVHTTLLRHAEFLELLHKSAEEYGFCNESVLRIPYEAQDFEEHWMVKRSKAKIYKGPLQIWDSVRMHISLPHKAPSAVCVGVDGDTKCFMVHTTVLRHTEFLELLHKSAEEYGFCNDSVLRIPYKAQDFEEYWMIKRSKARIYKVEPV